MDPRAMISLICQGAYGVVQKAALAACVIFWLSAGSARADDHLQSTPPRFFAPIIIEMAGGDGSASCFIEGVISLISIQYLDAKNP